MPETPSAPSAANDWRPMLAAFEKRVKAEDGSGVDPLLRNTRLGLIIARQLAELIKETKAMTDQQKLNFQIALREALEAKYEELEKPVRRLVELLRLERYGLLSDGVLEELDAIEKALPEQAPARS